MNLDHALVDWLREPSAERGLRFAGPRDTWQFWSYASLAGLTLRAAAGLADRGVRPGDVVALVQRSGSGFPAALFGAMAVGAIPCAVAPPFVYQRPDEYSAHVSRLLGVARPRAIVADADAAAAVAPTARQLGLPAPVSFADLIEAVEPVAAPARPGRHALLQFTSGSSGHARGVLVSSAALIANLRAMHRWVGFTADCPGATWLPVHHDMGLIGCLMNAVTAGSDAWIMQPDDFIRSPLRYLTCLSDNRLELTAMPNFGLAYILRRIRPAQLAGLRFDALRAIIIGAERIDPAVLRGFEDLLGPFGLDRRALLPAYGGAEATLAVTGLPLGAGWTAQAPPDAPQEARIVGCGWPLDGVGVTVADDQLEPVGEDVVGEIVVTGACVADGYLGEPGTASGTQLSDGVLRTGDAGFLSGGQLFVIGRLGDGLKLNGKMVFAESLEARLVARGIPERRAVVLLGVRAGAPTAAVLFKKADPGWAEIARAELRGALGDIDVLAVDVPGGDLALTSSGKPRRRVMWQKLCEGSLVN